MGVGGVGWKYCTIFPIFLPPLPKRHKGDRPNNVNIIKIISWNPKHHSHVPSLRSSLSHWFWGLFSITYLTKPTAFGLLPLSSFSCQTFQESIIAFLSLRPCLVSLPPISISTFLQKQDLEVIGKIGTHEYPLGNRNREEHSFNGFHENAFCMFSPPRLHSPICCRSFP